MVNIGAKDVEVSSSQFEHFSVTTSGDTKPGELRYDLEFVGEDS